MSRCFDALFLEDFWAGWWDQKNEGLFVDVNTGEVLKPSDYQPWFYGEPNGDTVENCVVVWTMRQSWNDLSCDKTAWHFCHFERSPYFQLRGTRSILPVGPLINRFVLFPLGLCSNQQFDDRFSWTSQLIEGKRVFNGFTTSRISWNSKIGKWQLQMLSDPFVYATVNTTTYPLGTLEWDVFNSSCSPNDHVVLNLSLNTCHENQYNCLDGRYGLICLNNDDV